MSLRHKQAGFTILELMIATMVFSVILLLVTYGIIQIGNRYYKATLQAQTQTAARNAVDEVARTLQYSSGNLTTPANNGTNGVYAYCVNGAQYAFVPHVQQDANGPTKHVFIAQPDDNGCALPAIGYFQADLPSNARDLLANRMRVANFIVQPMGSLGAFQVTLRVVTGEDDLLCSPGVNGDCVGNGTNPNPNLANTDLTCRPQTGSTYCAVSALSTAVTPRLNP